MQSLICQFCRRPDSFLAGGKPSRPESRSFFVEAPKYSFLVLKMPILWRFFAGKKMGRQSLPFSFFFASDRTSSRRASPLLPERRSRSVVSMRKNIALNSSPARKPSSWLPRRQIAFSMVTSNFVNCRRPDSNQHLIAKSRF